MTINISDNNPRISYSVASGVTQSTFTVPFEFFDDSDLNVYVDGILKTITSDYTVSGGDGSTGTVTMSVTGATSGSTVVLTRDTTIERVTDFTAGVDINRAALNTQLDTLTAISADVKDLAERSIRVEDLEIAPNLVLPSIANRANKLMMFDTEGAVSVASEEALGNIILGANFITDSFTGDGSTTAFTLSVAANSKNNTQVHVDGVYQNKATYSLSSATLTFSEAPPLNSSIEVVSGDSIAEGSSANSSAIDYNQGGTGAVDRTVKAKLQETVSVKDFGAVGDGVTDDTAAIQAAVDANLQSVIYFPEGIYKITSPIQLDTNVFLQGEVYNFGGTQIVPYDCAAFKIDGDLVDDGFAFNVRIKDMFINCTNVTNAQDYIIYLNNAYRCNLENIRIQNVAVSSSDVAAIVKVRGTNYINRLKEVYAIGTNNTGSGAGFDINVGKGNLVLQHCDSENLNRGFLIAMNSQVDMISPYCERVGQGIRIEPATLTSNGQPQLNVFGGYVDMPSSGSSGVLFSGTFNKDEIINFYGFRVGSNDHATKKTGFSTSGLTWSNDNHININGFDWSWVDTPSELRTAAYITPDNPYLNTAQNKEEHIFKITSLADNTATDVFKIEGMTTGDPYPPVYLKVRVYESFNGWGRALEESVFLIQDRSDQSAFTTTKQSIASVQETDSANFSITTLEVSATENSDNVTFSVTSDFNTAVLSTMPEVYFYVTMVGTGKLTLL